MEQVLAGLDHVEVYFDDILVTGRNEEEHSQTFAEVLKRLEASGLKFRKEECQFVLDKVEYLEFKVTNLGVGPTVPKWRQ